MEAAFQAFQAKRVVRPACTLHATVVFGWLSVLLLYIISPADTRRGFPFVAHAVTLTLGTSMWLLRNVMTQRARVFRAYAANWRAYNAAAAALQIVQSRTVREVLIWIQADFHADRDPGLGRTIQGFLAENPMLAFAVGRTIAWPTGVVSDVVLALADLASGLAHNPRTCHGQGITPGYQLSRQGITPEYPLSGQGITPAYQLVSLTGWFSFAAHELSEASLMMYGAAPLPLVPTPGAMSCTATLAFWQVQAVLLIGMAAVGKEVLSRRAFLRENPPQEPRAWDGPLPAHGVHGIGFGHVWRVTLWLLLGHVTLWACILAYDMRA
jgi:hypothetical protein